MATENNELLLRGPREKPTVFYESPTGSLRTFYKKPGNTQLGGMRKGSNNGVSPQTGRGLRVYA